MKIDKRAFGAILLIFVAVDFAVAMVRNAMPTLHPVAAHAVDALLLALFGAPLVWFIVARPVARAAAREAAREAAERNRATESLRLFRTLVDRSNDALEIIDPESGRFLDVNEKGCSDLGYTREELLKLSIFDVVPSFDVATFVQSRERLSEAGVMLLTGVHQRKDGSTYPVEISLSRVRIDREYEVAVVRDISERVSAEAARLLHSTALNASAVPMLITDREGRIVWVNAAFTAGTGYTAEDAVGRNPRALLRSGAHEPAFYRRMWETILAGQVWSGEMTNRRKDGSEYAEAQTITPVTNARGEITHFIAIKRDLTDEKQREAQFLQAQKMESVGQLAGGVAHDFNNLLAVILGWTEMALADLPPEHSVVSPLQEVLSASQRAADLTRQLLAFSRRQVHEPTVFDVNAVVHAVEKMLRPLMGEDVELVVHSSPEPRLVKMDRGQLEQVLMNLAVNARDAMPRGGRLTVVISSIGVTSIDALRAAEMPPGEYVTLAVTDTGTGMSAAVLAHVFEPFFTTKATGRGTGLGLATCYGIVQNAGGYLGVSSAEGIGTTMTVYLPPTREAPAAPIRKRKTTPLRGVETVFLVEDEPAVRRVVARMLEARGYRVLVCGAGEEALRMLAAEHEAVHLLLTDVVLAGGMSGPELVSRIHGERPRLKVLYMSGYTGDGAKVDTAVGRDAPLVQKPFSAAALAEAVRQALDGA